MEVRLAEGREQQMLGVDVVEARLLGLGLRDSEERFRVLAESLEGIHARSPTGLTYRAADCRPSRRGRKERHAHGSRGLPALLRHVSLHPLEAGGHDYRVDGHARPGRGLVESLVDLICEPDCCGLRHMTSI